MQEIKNDNVNHPNHYCQEGSMECIDEMVAVFGKESVMDFCLLNVWKYRKRALFKNQEEDIKKSDWYMNKYVELKESEGYNKAIDDFMEKAESLLCKNLIYQQMEDIAERMKEGWKNE